MIILEIIFWLTIAAVFYAYAGYPIVLFILSSASQTLSDLRFIINRGDRRTGSDADNWPGVSLIITAYNEEDVLAAKLDNCMTLEYPREKLEIVVASDGSSDRTNEIARSYADRGVTLIDYAERQGKISVINRTVPEATHEVVVLSDANTMYEPEAIKNLVLPLRRENVGVVVGEMVLESPNQEHKGERYYWRYEVMLKYMENKLGAILGANGGLYAMRKDLFEPVPDSTIVDDFVIPLKIAEKGYRQVYSPAARATEETARDVHAELVRRKRIAAGNFQSILLLWRLLNPLRGYIAFTFWSHKLMRWFAPFFMAGALLVNIPLMFLEHGLYSVLFVAQVLFYGGAWVGFRASHPLVKKLCAIPYYFVSMNLGMMQGLFNFIRGRQKVTWDKIQR